MAVLNDSHHFLHKTAGHRVQDALKERLVVVQLECKLELELESLPNVVIFAHFRPRITKHLALQKVVKLGGFFPVLAECVHFDETFFRATLFRYVEFIGALGIVHAVLVRQLKQLIHSGTGCQMSVMHSWLRHHVEALIEFGID